MSERKTKALAFAVALAIAALPASAKTTTAKPKPTPIAKATTSTAAQIQSLITKTLDAYLSVGRFIGPPGPQGPQGAAGATVSTYPANPSANSNGGSIAGFSQLSASNLTVDQATTTKTLNVSGNANVTGGLTAGSLTTQGLSVPGNTTTGSLKITGLTNQNCLGTDAGGVVGAGTCGGGGTSPAGTTGQIQFNNAGAFGADPNLAWTPSGPAALNVTSQSATQAVLGVSTVNPTIPLQGINIYEESTANPGTGVSYSDGLFSYVLQHGGWVTHGIESNVIADTTNSGGGGDPHWFDAFIGYAEVDSGHYGWAVTYDAQKNLASSPGTIDTNVAFYTDSQAGVGTNNYDFWADERGVFRIKTDNTFNGVYQAIPALYNPQFTQYTPGATDFERVVMGQWNSNVAEIGAQAGGSGTLRPLRLIGASVQLPFGSGNPGCTSSADIGKEWIDTTSSVTTHFKICAEVSSTPTWVTVF